MKMVLTATPQNMYLCLQGSDRMYNKWIDKYDQFNKDVQGIIQLRDAQLIYMNTDLDDQTLDWYDENGVIDTIFFIFDNGVKVTYTTDIDLDVLLPFFADDFRRLTVNEFVIALAFYIQRKGYGYPEITKENF